mmetsp:Transcript_34777/g.61210  ORF Transcript_34777/g.61210 Transcript_34777/m.61210 type:complete len:239 (+) Transcript_34777:75-791(+)
MLVTSRGLVDTSRKFPLERLETHKNFPQSTKPRLLFPRKSKPLKPALIFNFTNQTVRMSETEDEAVKDLMRHVSPLRPRFQVVPEEKRSKSVFPTECVTYRREIRVKQSPTLEYSFMRVPDFLPRLPKRHQTFTQRREENQEFTDELISKDRFNQFVEHSYKIIKRVKRAPKLTQREIKNLETNRRKREELKAMMHEMNSSKEEKFAEIVDKVRRDFGLKEIDETGLNKFNSFDKCLD